MLQIQHKTLHINSTLGCKNLLVARIFLDTVIAKAHDLGQYSCDLFRDAISIIIHRN
jgi:hypothetical protein